MVNANTKSVPMATTPFYDVNKYEVLGIDTAISVMSVSIVRGFGAGVGAMFGGRSNLLEKVFFDAREDAYKKLAATAQKMGADLVIGVEVEVQEQNQFFIFTASGTMLKKKKKIMNRG